MFKALPPKSPKNLPDGRGCNSESCLRHCGDRCGLLPNPQSDAASEETAGAGFWFRPDGIFRGTVTIEYHSTQSGAAPAVNGTTSDVTNVSVSATVSIDPSKLEIQVVPSNKNASFSFTRKGDVIISSTCQRQVFNIAETGSSLSLLAQETMFSIQLTDTAYTFSTGDVVGSTTTTGTVTEQFVVTDRCIEVAPNDPITRQISRNTARHSYLPERISGTGSIGINAADGSKTISGTSTKSETLESSPGVTQTTNYTMTWNLTAF